MNGKSVNVQNPVPVYYINLLWVKSKFLLKSLYVAIKNINVLRGL